MDEFQRRLYAIPEIPVAFGAIFEFFGDVGTLRARMAARGVVDPPLIPVDWESAGKNRRTLLAFGQDEETVRAYVHACADRIHVAQPGEPRVDAYARKEISRLMEQVWFPRLGV